MSVMAEATQELLERLERYYDAVPRTNARAEAHGSLTLFVTEGPGWPYYARPSLTAATGRASDVRAVRSRQRALDVPEAFEWVAETSPWFAGAATRAGLTVHVHPLLVLDAAAWRPSDPPEDMQVRRIEADDPYLVASRSVAAVAFAYPGTEMDDVGRDDAHENPALDAFARERIKAGTTVTYAAFGEDGPVSVGSHQPVDGVTEIVGVGTVPSARRRGLGAAVTSALVDDALRSGAELVFLAAAEDAVARIYARLGFVRVATAMVAAPPDPS
jgi:GNAT superfamily N-acetyltransferase